jgi:hypothetical protein
MDTHEALVDYFFTMWGQECSGGGVAFALSVAIGHRFGNCFYVSAIVGCLTFYVCMRLRLVGVLRLRLRALDWVLICVWLPNFLFLTTVATTPVAAYCNVASGYRYQLSYVHIYQLSYLHISIVQG